MESSRHDKRRRSGRRMPDEDRYDRRSSSRSRVNNSKGRHSLPSLPSSAGHRESRHKEKGVGDLDSSSRNSLLEMGRESERRIRRHSLVPTLPDSDTFRFQAKEKERYIKNMHTLIVTARSEMRKLRSEIAKLHEKLKSHSVVKCPKCGHPFSSSENRLLPRHIRVLRGTNRIELQFESIEQLEQWLNLTNHDRDRDSLPVLLTKETRSEETLLDVGSALRSAGSEARA